MGNDLQGTITLTCEPCNQDIHYKDEALKTATATRIRDGELQTVYACYFETYPDADALKAVTDNASPGGMTIELFGLVHIIESSGVIHDTSARQFTEIQPRPDVIKSEN